jgi:hypothetical protein
MVDTSQREIDRPLLDIGAIFDRIAQEKGFKADQALAQFLGRSPQAISQSRKTGKGDLWTLIEACADMDLGWILLGRRTPRAISTAEMMQALVDAGYRVEKAPPAPGEVPRTGSKS